MKKVTTYDDIDAASAADALKVGKYTAGHTEVATSPAKKKSYHSIVVPMAAPNVIADNFLLFSAILYYTAPCPMLMLLLIFNCFDCL